mmetsp:Transcript_42985/g.84066  ORF Transcript_42985/g.84066 Transcript_42985/m.84066 type:complete len:254 (+) Transcript_42985:99-860(+)
MPLRTATNYHAWNSPRDGFIDESGVSLDKASFSAGVCKDMGHAVCKDSDHASQQVAARRGRMRWLVARRLVGKGTNDSSFDSVAREGSTQPSSPSPGSDGPSNDGTSSRRASLSVRDSIEEVVREVLCPRPTPIARAFSSLRDRARKLVGCKDEEEVRRNKAREMRIGLDKLILEYQEIQQSMKDREKSHSRRTSEPLLRRGNSAGASAQGPILCRGSSAGASASSKRVSWNDSVVIMFDDERDLHVRHVVSA